MKMAKDQLLKIRGFVYLLPAHRAVAVVAMALARLQEVHLNPNQLRTRCQQPLVNLQLLQNLQLHLPLQRMTLHKMKTIAIREMTIKKKTHRKKVTVAMTKTQKTKDKMSNKGKKKINLMKTTRQTTIMATNIQ